MGNFWSYVDSFQHLQPVNTTLVVSMVGIFLYQWYRKVEAQDIAFRFDAVVRGGEWWRCLTSTFSHLSILHILLNMVSLWLMWYMEDELGSIAYLLYTAVLVLGCQACMVVGGFMLERWKPSWLSLTNGAGYSGVLFGWMMLYAMRDPLGSTSIFGLPIPSLVLPFVYLFGTQLLIRNVSFIGHLSGIVIGLLISVGLVRWFDYYLLLALLIWLPLLFLWNVKLHSPYPLPWLSVATPAMQQSRVRDGQIVHSDRERERARERAAGGGGVG
jgi:membrane associated rhomboid family serine protease